MAKKKRRAQENGDKPVSPALQASAGTEHGGGEGAASRFLWLFSLVLIISGYSLLHKVDPGGQNAWAVAAPALLLSGYLLIIPSILLTFRGKP